MTKIEDIIENPLDWVRENFPIKKVVYEAPEDGDKVKVLENVHGIMQGPYILILLADDTLLQIPEERVWLVHHGKISAKIMCEIFARITVSNAPETFGLKKRESYPDSM